MKITADLVALKCMTCFIVRFCGFNTKSSIALLLVSKGLNIANGCCYLSCISRPRKYPEKLPGKLPYEFFFFVGCFFEGTYCERSVPVVLFSLESRTLGQWIFWKTSGLHQHCA